MSEAYLLGDGAIQNGWSVFDDNDEDCVADNDYIMSAGGIGLIYHSQYRGQFGPTGCGEEKYFYDPVTETVVRDDEESLGNFAQKGDIFVQYMPDPEGDYNHYGLIYDYNRVLDANWGLNGKLRNDSDLGTRNSDRWKVARPQ